MTANDVTRSLDISTEQDRFGGSYRFRSFSHSKSDPGYGANGKLAPKQSPNDEHGSNTRKHQQQRAVIVTTTTKQTQQQQQQQPLVTNRYKTELCRPFQEYGHCRYGDKCQFAHGKDDLKTPIRHPKYKTELCRTYHSQGYCPYGARCHFVHSTVEVRQSPAATLVAGRSTCPPGGGNIRPPHLTASHISFNKPPLSPSQDSGISSPPDTGTPNSVKMFEYPLSDGSSSDDQDADAIGGSTWGPGSMTTGAMGGNVNDLQFNCDPSSNWDTLSNESYSPMKSVPFYTDPIDDLSDHFSTTSLDDGLSLNRTTSRLPIFNQLNSFSDTSLLSSQHNGEDW